jgi:hypothetical protein
MGEKGKACRILMEKPEGKIPLGGSRRKWEDNNKMDFREIEWFCMDLIGLVQDRDLWRAFVNTVMKLRFP